MIKNYDILLDWNHRTSLTPYCFVKGLPTTKTTQGHTGIIMEGLSGQQIVINKTKDITKIDFKIMDDLYNGKHIYILKSSHINTCEDNENGLFHKLCNNNDDLFRLLFIKENLKQEFKMMEYNYFSSVENPENPFPGPPFFYWTCPVCNIHFDNM